MLSPRKALGCVAALALAVAAPARSADADKYVPADAEAVLHVNVEQLLGSALAKKYALPHVEKWLRDNKEAQQAFTAVGLDPLKDVASVTVSNAGQTGDKVLVAVRGKFDREKMHAAAEAAANDKKDDFKISKVGDKPLYEAAQKGGGKSVYVAFVEKGTIVASTSRGYVVAVLEGKAGRPNESLREAMAGVDTKQSIWVAGLVSEPMKQAIRKYEPAAALAPKLKTFTGGLTVTDAIAAGAQLQTADAKAARDAGELATGAKGMLQFLAQTNEEIAPFANGILKTLEIKTDRADVSVSLKISEELIEKALKKLPRQ